MSPFLSGSKTASPPYAYPRPVVLGLSLPGHPNASLVAAVTRAGGLGVLDLTAVAPMALEYLKELGRTGEMFAIRLESGREVDPHQVPEECGLVILGPKANLVPWLTRAPIVEVLSVDEARRAADAGAVGIIARGSECGGRVGEETAFILSQHILSEVDLPLWVQGGIGLHTAAAAIAGGAAGVVIDSQLALTTESNLEPDLRRTLEKTDGTGTVLEGGIRFLPVPGRPEARIVVGQDAFLAGGLAERFHTAGGVVRAFLEAIVSHVRSAKEVNPLGEGAGVAALHGTRYPIVQGPMTRVSDGPEFAEAVAGAGGLPLLALALMRGEPLHELMGAAKGRLSGVPWGVGIIGFGPPEILKEQLEAILDVRPRFALIAGGRPSQSVALEKAGIATYLHVPSPGLLDLFLKQGARRFVFEGSECGGHIGPHSSFCLWESQVARLLAFDRPREVSVLFAGGIHDSVSAAMVGAMAAPLSERGVRVGVLMGTAYLFTREAMETGAILSSYQDVALTCTRTALLETAPGHVTRCAETDSSTAFQREKGRLEAAGLEREQIWAQLEEMNLGRLRIAAKGVKREGAEILEVDAATQRKEGLYMMGQVAVLKKDPVTIADLHREVSVGSSERLEAVAVVDDIGGERCDTDFKGDNGAVAIIGMACVFPGAEDSDAFWSNIVYGESSISEVPVERWDPETYYDPNGPAGEKTPSKWGGFISDVLFDPLTYGIPPRSLAAIEPVQLLSLEVSRRALRDAGYAEREFNRERTSVIFGAESGTDLAGAYSFRALYPHYVGGIPPELDAQLPLLTEDSFPGILSNVIAGRVANRLDFGGVNYTVDAACASSLAAVDLACKELASGSSDMVLAGGADLHNSIGDFLLFASVHALSFRGRCDAFDMEADGTVLGEGVAVVVLKRLEDAIRDGDRVYAVIRGIAGSSDGKSLGLTAPRREGQVRALERAYSQARVSPVQIGLIEAHGTGTVVGDATELGTLDTVFTTAGAAAGTCVLGSVKSLVGHTKCAAGMAGLIKAAMAIYTGVLPPANHIRKPNSAFQPSSSPFTFLSRASPWISSERAAGVSAFGFGGTNFHAVIGQGPETDKPPPGLINWPAELFVFRAADPQAVEELADRLAAVVDTAGGTVRLRDLAYSLWQQSEGPVQGAIVASSVGELVTGLSHLRTGTEKPGSVFLTSARAGKVAFLFPGQGSQRPGMLAELFVAFPEIRHFLGLYPDLEKKIYPPAAFSPEALASQRTVLADTRNAQPALGICDLAIAELLARCDVRPDMLAGHSYGELVALCVSGTFNPVELIRLSRARAECILEAVGSEPGAMAAVAASSEEIAEHLDPGLGVTVVNFNAPRQNVIAGSRQDVEEAMSRLKGQGFPCKQLPVACAFHSSLVQQAGETFADVLGEAEIAPPEIQVWSNATAGPYLLEVGDVRRKLAEQVVSPVLFSEQILSMYEAGARTFVEAGPGRVLSDLVGQILEGRQHTAVAMNAGGGSEIRQFLTGLASLAVAGIPVELSWLFAERASSAIDLSNPAAAAPPDSAWRTNGFRTVPLMADSPALPARDRTPSAGVSAAGSSQGVISEYLRNMRELVAAQREAVLQYLGSEKETVPFRAPPPGSAVKNPDASQERAAIDPAKELIAVVSDRTGYPPEMLDLDMDLEADLSIDSIKRIEIIGVMAERLGLQGGDLEEHEGLIEDLARMRNLREMIAFLNSALEEKGVDGSGPDPAPETPAPHPPRGPERFVISSEAVPGAEVTEPDCRGRTFLMLGDSEELTYRLTEILTNSGGHVVNGGDGSHNVDVIVYFKLAGVGDGADTLPDLFARAKSMDPERNCHIVVGTRAATNNNGLSGFLRSLTKDRPALSSRLVEIDPSSDSDGIARLLFTEILSDDDLREVSYADGSRKVPRLIPVPVRGNGKTYDLGPDAVVLITGGARGITSHVTVELANRYRPRIILVGRSPMPDLEQDNRSFEGLDAAGVRRALIDAGRIREPQLIEAETRSILSSREILRTIRGIEEAGATWEYHSLDVRDQEGFGDLVADLYQRFGRIDGVIHAAGVIEDKLIDQKSWESFSRVYETKLSPVRSLSKELRSGVRFVAFFSSVSGVFGNRGQVDYAAASDALNRQALPLNDRLPGRVFSISWGPWEGTGMVSEELAREFRRRGIGLIRPEDGVDAFFRELESGDDGDVRVVWMDATEDDFR